MYIFLCIVKDMSTGRFHVMYWREAPLPSQGGEPIEKLEFLRFKSGGHHTEGAEDWQGAMEHLAEVREGFGDKIISDDYVCEVPIPQSAVGHDVWMLPNFVGGGYSVTEALAKSGLIKKEGDSYMAVPGVIED